MAVTRRFGAYDVTIFIDGIYKAPVEHIVHATDAALVPDILKGWGQATVDVDVNLFALKGPDGLTLVDAGTGTAWGSAYGHARAAMREAGILPEDVKRILLTHVHGDHALGLFDGTGRYFPDAEIWVPEAELAFFTDPLARERLPEARRSAFGIAQKLIEIYGDRVKRIAHGSILPGVVAIPLPGHTPGHVGYIIGEGREALLLWGDALHSVGLQGNATDIGFVYDIDPLLAAQTRRAGVEAAIENSWIVSGGHVSGFVRVERVDGTLRFTPA